MRAMRAMTGMAIFWLPFALADEQVMLQLSQLAPMDTQDILCRCGDHCPSMAAAKNVLVNSCIENSKQDVLCTEGADAAFAGHALDGTFDVAICAVLQRIFRQLGFLGNSSGSTEVFGTDGIFGPDLEPTLWRRRLRREAERKSEDQGRHYSTDSRDTEVANNTDTQGLKIGTVIITHGDANNVSVSNDHSVAWDSSSGNRDNTVETGSRNEVPFNNGNRVSVGSDNTVPIGSGNVVPIGSGNVIPIGSGNVIVPIGSGNVVVVPVGSGNDVSVPVGSGNQVTVPVGSGNQVIVPVGSGNVVVIQGSNNTINIVSANASNTSSM